MNVIQLDIWNRNVSLTLHNPRKTLYQNTKRTKCVGFYSCGRRYGVSILESCACGPHIIIWTRVYIYMRVESFIFRRYCNIYYIIKTHSVKSKKDPRNTWFCYENDTTRPFPRRTFFSLATPRGIVLFFFTLSSGYCFGGGPNEHRKAVFAH